MAQRRAQKSSGAAASREDSHVVREQRVQRPLQRLLLEGARQIEGDHLAEGVDAGVGPPRGRDAHGLAARETRERLLEHALDRARPGLPRLDLPAGEVGPVVRERQAVTRHVGSGLRVASRA